MKHDEMIELVSVRYYMLIRGWMKAGDVAKFVPCSRDVSYRIVKEIRSSNTKEGIENLHSNVVLTRKVLEYLGMTESQVRKEYERYERQERKNGSAQSTKANNHANEIL